MNVIVQTTKEGLDAREVHPEGQVRRRQAKPGPSRDTLIKAAKLRSEGATWNAVREATGAKLGSSGWFRHWEREGIDHIPAGQRRVTDKAEAEPETPTHAAEAAKPPKPKRTVKRSGKASGPRTSDDKRHRATTRADLASEGERIATA